MAYMVKNPGLIPGVESLRAGDVGKKRVMIKEILDSTYESCILPDPEDPAKRPFLCDAIISNPPAFGHIHCAQRLQVPLHIFFTMPWSQTHAFPHPLTNMSYSNTPRHQMNYLSYDIVELLTWEGLGDIINNFRAGLLLPKLSTAAAVPYLRHLHVPHSYLWSQSLIAKPEDWGSWIDVVGFVFLDLASSYTPPQDLVDFLNAGEKPVYIGFGSIVVDDPDAMTKLVFDAVKESGVRAIVSKGWGGIGGGDLKVPENVYLIGNCPHDWLFLQVAGVVHHGGAGTTAAGLKAGKPTFIVPFFGDQPFWGSMVATVNAGPAPIPYKDLNVENFAASIKHLLQSEVIEAAQKVSVHMNQENGAIAGARSFHRFIFEKSTGQRLSERAVDEWTKDGLIKRSDLVKI
ncbi:UDP-Glycosyltransferase/glycogen phosphorylase, partial [Rhizoclosmatium globosum]